MESSSVVAKVPDVHFQANIFGKDMNLSIPTSYGLNSILYRVDFHIK